MTQAHKTRHTLLRLCFIAAFVLPSQAVAGDDIREIVAHVQKKLERAEIAAKASIPNPVTTPVQAAAIPQPASTAWENFAISRTEADTQDMRADITATMQTIQ